jgi:hypothetical protein
MVIVWEDLWAVPLVEAAQASGGVVMESARIPRELVEAAFEELHEAIELAKAG